MGQTTSTQRNGQHRHRPYHRYHHETAPQQSYSDHGRMRKKASMPQLRRPPKLTFHTGHLPIIASASSTPLSSPTLTTATATTAASSAAASASVSPASNTFANTRHTLARITSRIRLRRTEDQESQPPSSPLSPRSSSSEHDNYTSGHYYPHSPPPLHPPPGCTGLTSPRLRLFRSFSTYLEQSSASTSALDRPLSCIDPEIIERADLTHEMVRYVQRRNYTAILAQPKRILDVGCGTGRWVKDMAREFPRTKVIGCDVQPVFVTHGMPKNARFELADIIQGLPFADATFDYVHLRFLGLDIPTHQWPSVLTELYRVCKPGGWVEVNETDGVVRQPGPASHCTNRWMASMTKRVGVDVGRLSSLDQVMSRVGFSAVLMRNIQYPLGDWAGAAGTIQYRIYRSMFDMYRQQTLATVEQLEEDADSVLATQATTLEEYQSYIYHYVYTAQRPLTTGPSILSCTSPMTVNTGW